MRVAIIGGEGQVARELMAARWPAGTVLEGGGRGRFNLADPAGLSAALTAVKPDLIVNAGAYTAVDKAESEEDAAYALNATGPGAAAQTAARLNVPFIHLSTDYVFDGTGQGPYREEDAVGPVSAYGRTKEAGERLVRAAAARHLILRTAWVYSPFGTNFVKTMLWLGAERDRLTIVEDQRGCPTAAADIASAIVALAPQAAAGLAGTFHLTGQGETSWFGFARAIFEGAAQRGHKVPGEVAPIPTSAYPTPAKRPANSVLSGDKLAAAAGIRLRPWPQALSDCLDILCPAAGQAGGPSGRKG